MRKLIAASVIALTTLAGCAGLSDREQRIISGAAIGGVAGNVLGSGSTGATVGGAVIGGLIGSEVDRNRSDRRYEDARRRYDSCRRANSRTYCDRQYY